MGKNLNQRVEERLSLLLEDRTRASLQAVANVTGRAALLRALESRHTSPDGHAYHFGPPHFEGPRETSLAVLEDLLTRFELSSLAPEEAEGEAWPPPDLGLWDLDLPPEAQLLGGLEYLIDRMPEGRGRLLYTLAPTSLEDRAEFLQFVAALESCLESAPNAGRIRLLLVTPLEEEPEAHAHALPGPRAAELPALVPLPPGIWDLRASVAELHPGLETLAVPSDMPEEVRERLQLIALFQSLQVRPEPDGLRQLDERITRYQASGQRELLQLGLLLRGQLRLTLEQLDPAEADLKRCLEVSLENGQPAVAAAPLLFLASLARNRGDLPTALEIYYQLQALSAECLQPSLWLMAAVGLGEVLEALQRPDQALPWCDAALKLSRASGDEQTSAHLEAQCARLRGAGSKPSNPSEQHHE